MKCENCGKNEVSFVYQSNINGHVEEKHLCSACAEKLGYMQAVAAQSRRMMRGFFGGGLLDDFFSPRLNLLCGAFFGENLFDDFFQQMPALGTAVEEVQEPQEKPLVEEKERSRFCQNAPAERPAFGAESRRAAGDFEKAAQIRDQIREMEQQKKPEEKKQEHPQAE